MANTYNIELDSGRKYIYNSSRGDEIIFEGCDINSVLNYSKSGNNLIITPDFDNTSVVLVDYFKQSKENALNLVNGKDIFDDGIIELEGRGKIYGTFMDDIIYGSNSADTIYASGGADDVYAKGGNDVIYTSKEGSFVDGGAGNDKIYVNPTDVIYSEELGDFITPENIFTFYNGSGSDTIYNSGYWDRIEIYDISSEDISYNIVGNDLIIQSKLNSNDSIKLVDWNKKGLEERTVFVKYYDSENPEIDYTCNLNDEYKTIVGTKGNDVFNTLDSGWKIALGKGNDVINITNPSSYENYIKYYNGDGSDIINNSSNYESITIYDIKPVEVAYLKEDDDLIIQSLINKNDSIRITDWFLQDEGLRLDTVTFIDSEIGYSDDGVISLSEQSISTLKYGTTKNDTLILDDNTGSRTICIPGKGNDTIFVDGAGTKQINLALGEGNTKIEYGEDIEDCVVEINYTIPEAYLTNTEDHEMEFCYDKKGDDLLIYCVDWERKGSRIIDTITIVDYYKTGKELIQGNTFFADIDFQPEVPVQELINLTPSYINAHMFYKEATSKGGELNTEEITSSVIYLGNNGHDIMSSNPDKVLGDQFYTGDKGITEIYSGKGDDYIEINNFSTSDTTINDSMYVHTEYASSEDELHINTPVKGDGAFIFFDVATDEENQPEEYSPNLYITKNSNIMSFMGDKYSPGFISIENWFAERNVIMEDSMGEYPGESSGSGKIEHIYFNGGRIEYEEYIARVTDDVRAELIKMNNNGANYESAMDVLIRGSKTDKNAIVNCYTKENAHIILDESFEKEIFNGSNGNDVIFANNGYTVNGGKGNDKLYKFTGATDYILNGEDGNDVLEAGENTIINGGTGVNVIKINSEDTTIITQGKGKDYLHFVDDDLVNMTYSKEGDDLVMSNLEGSTTIKDYFKYNTKSSIKGIIDSSASSEVSEGLYEDDFASEIVEAISGYSEKKTITDLLTSEDVQLWNEVIPSKDKFTGTEYNDKIDAQDVYLEKVLRNGRMQEIVEREISDKGLTINGGNGNNEIDGTKYSDTIIGGKDDDEIRTGTGADIVTGGTGINTIEYDNIKFVDGDRINLTKGEQLILDFSTLEDASFEYRINGKDLEITVTARTYDEFGEPEELHTGTLKLINFATKDITNNSNLKKGIEDSSCVKIRTSEDLDGFDLRTILLSQIDIIKNYNGTWLNEDINAEDFVARDRYGNEIENNIKGLTIKGNGGDDTITGSKYNDTITGGADENTIVYKLGSGQDTIILTKGETLFLNIINNVDHVIESEKLIFTPAKNKNDLEITIDGDPDSKITIKNYYGKETGATVYINGVDLAYYENSIFQVDDSYFVNTSKYNGCALADNVNASSVDKGITVNVNGGDDKVVGSDNNDTINGGNGNDLIYGGAGSDKLYGGNGDDKIHTSFKFYEHIDDVASLDQSYDLVKAGNGDDTIYVGSNKADVYGEAGQDTYYVKALDANIIDSAGSDFYYIDRAYDLDIVDNNGSDEYNISGVYNFDGLEAAEIEITDKNGDDIYRINLGDYVDIEINEAKGSDTYEVSDLANVFVEITDKNGNDNIVLTQDSKDDVTLLFDVKVDRYGRAITPVNKELVILDNSEINNFLHSPEGSYTGIVVENYFGSNASKVETITDMSANYLDTASIEAIRENVANWLADSGYSSSMEALNSLNQGDPRIDELLAIYQGANWQAPSLV